jgi:predicted HicB family RNase H-like nuclease
MTKHKKLLARAWNNPKDISFDEFQTLLSQTGWTLDHRRAATRFGTHRCAIGFQSRKEKAGRQKATKLSNSFCSMRSKMEKHDQFDGYTVNIFLDDDGEYLAHFVEMPNVSAFGGSPEDALMELATAWEGVKESYQKHGEPIPVAPAKKEYSGQFNVRIDRRLHRALAIEAAKAGVSLNAIVSQKLARSTI